MCVCMCVVVVAVAAAVAAAILFTMTSQMKQVKNRDERLRHGAKMQSVS